MGSETITKKDTQHWAREPRSNLSKKSEGHTKQCVSYCGHAFSGSCECPYSVSVGRQSWVSFFEWVLFRMRDTGEGESRTALRWRTSMRVKGATEERSDPPFLKKLHERDHVGLFLFTERKTKLRGKVHFVPEEKVILLGDLFQRFGSVVMKIRCRFRDAPE